MTFLSITSDMDTKRCRQWSLHHNAHGIMSSLNTAAMHRDDVTEHYVHHNASNCHWAPCTQNITMHTDMMLMRNSSQCSKNDVTEYDITVYTKCQWTLYQNVHNMISSLNITSEKTTTQKWCRCWTLQHSYPCSWSDLDQPYTQKNVHWTLYQNTYEMPTQYDVTEYHSNREHKMIQPLKITLWISSLFLLFFFFFFFFFFFLSLRPDITAVVDWA